ncbi:MAG: D-alanyl-D-alanine dipeptidase, partial [Prochlorococcaceae cyanobacterium]
MAPRPWNQLPIQSCDEPLLELPTALLRLEPHPYQALGAPYGEGLSPFRLREGVLRRLLLAQEALAARSGGWQLAIFDAWRPLEVQAFMLERAFEAECRRRGLDPHSSG